MRCHTLWNGTKWILVKNWIKEPTCILDIRIWKPNHLAPISSLFKIFSCSLNSNKTLQCIGRYLFFASTLHIIMSSDSVNRICDKFTVCFKVCTANKEVPLPSCACIPVHTVSFRVFRSLSLFFIKIANIYVIGTKNLLND